MPKQPILTFYMKLPERAITAQIRGTLILQSEQNKAGKVFWATSGLPGYQHEGSWSQKGRGVIPPSAIIGMPHWSLSTQRLWMPEVRGVEGSFFAIAPFAVQLGNVSRGDFGIHFDANVPGSAGCIVLPSQDHWDTFRKDLEYLRLEGVQKIPLDVVYNERRHINQSTQTSTPA